MSVVGVRRPLGAQVRQADHIVSSGSRLIRPTRPIKCIGQWMVEEKLTSQSASLQQGANGGRAEVNAAGDIEMGNVRQDLIGLAKNRA